MGGSRWSIDHRVGAPLGLGALAGVVDHEGVEERDVAERDVGVAAGDSAERLARQPLERAVLAQVDDGVGAPALVEPAVEGQVVVGGRQVGRVVDGDGVVAVAPRRLDGDEHVAEVEAAEHERAVVDPLAPGRRSPLPVDLVLRAARAGWRTSRRSGRRRAAPTAASSWAGVRVSAS